jgi:endonuclease YncB( thermonuclease family)
VIEAEKEARAEKRGVWSDAMREEREADGYR